MRKYVLLFVLLSATLFAAPDTPSAKWLMESFKFEIEDWYDGMKDVAYSLWTILAVIEVVLVFGFKLLRGDFELGSVMADLIRLTLVFGFFAFLIESTYYLMDILRGYSWISNQIGSGINLDNFIVKIFNIIGKIWDKLSILRPGEAIMITAIILVTAGVFFVLVGQAVKNYVFALISVYASSIWFGVSVFSHTRQYGINSLVSIFRYGAKYMFFLLVIGLLISILSDYFNVNDDMKIKDLVFILFAVIVSKEIAEGIEGYVDGVFNGHGGSSSSVMTGYMQRSAATVQGAAVGATKGLSGGAAGGYSAIKEAAAAGGSGSNSSGGIKAAMKATGGGLVGAVGGAATGAIKGAFGTANQGTGQGSGAMAAKAVGGTIKAATNTAKGAVKMATGGTGSTGSTGKASTKDRTGFDTSLLKSDGGSTGEIKGAQH